MSMNLQVAREEYTQAYRAAQKEIKNLSSAGKPTAPAVLDNLIENTSLSFRDLGVLEIPANRIVGTVSVGRIGALSPTFRPLLPPDSEFAAKWSNLCAAHLGEEGIRDPILCYEYLGDFYVQEGNKRVSVLRHFGAPRIEAQVRRIMPPVSDDPRIRAYYEFLKFYKDTGMYLVQYRRPGDYDELLSYLGKESGEAWDEREVRTFKSYFRYFSDALEELDKSLQELLPEEALLLWLKIYPFQDLGRMTSQELKKSVAGLKKEMKTLTEDVPVNLHLEPTAGKSSLLNYLLPIKPDYVRVAFVHAMDPQSSEWIAGHDRGRKYLEETLTDQVRVRSYFHADTPAMAERLLEQAVAEGASIIFTTVPQLQRETLRMAVKYPKVKFLNCAVNSPYSSIRSYYGRMYEAKFITGAIAGAMADGNDIGYIGTAPIWGVPASINAFALGAQLTNPRARVVLRWSCLPGQHQYEMYKQGIRVISNRDIPTDGHFLEGYNYGTYQFDESNRLQALASPVWVWGKFYVSAVRSWLDGTWEKDQQSNKAVNYWWGMESGLIDIKLSANLPEGVAVLAKTLRQAMQEDIIHPFFRKLVAQDGTVKNDGSRNLFTEELLKMDWLCENVEGQIPEFSQITGIRNRSLVREQGVYRDRIPKEKEGSI